MGCRTGREMSRCWDYLPIFGGCRLHFSDQLGQVLRKPRAVADNPQADALACQASGYDLTTSNCLNFTSGLVLTDPDDQAFLRTSVDNVAAGRDENLERWTVDAPERPGQSAGYHRVSPL